MAGTDQPAEKAGESSPDQPDRRSTYYKLWGPIRGVLLITEMVMQARNDEGPALVARALAIAGDCAVALAGVKRRTRR